MLARWVSGTALAVCLSCASGAATASTFLTDSTIFSANSEGNNWLGWIWNTQGQPVDAANRWNMYYSTSSDPSNPVFINSGNDAGTEISIELSAGTHDFLVYGESVTTIVDPLTHFVLNLYFNGNQSAPGISAVAGATCATVCAAGHPNGLDLFGNSGQQEAGTLSFIDGGHQITLTQFNWTIGGTVDEVWPHWANDAPYDSGSGAPDYVGQIQLTVTPVPLPASGLMLLAGLGGLSVLARRKR